MKKIKRSNLLFEDSSENVTDSNLLYDIMKLHYALMSPTYSNDKLKTLKTLGSKINLINHVKKNNVLNKKVDAIAKMKRYNSKPKKDYTQGMKTSTNIIYNRINKAGSTSIQALFGGLSVSNQFHIIGYGRPMIRYFFPNQKQRLAETLCDETHGQLLYTRHIYFMDLARFGCNIKYINMVGNSEQEDVDNSSFSFR